VSDWESQWDGRLAALELVFGKSDGVVSHAVVPFQLGYDAGGRADVVHFSEHVTGLVSSTCELISEDGQLPNSLGAYELAICHRAPDPWYAQVLSSLAYYTLETRLESGQTMDIGPLVPRGSTISAFLFEEFARFAFQGRSAGVLLCIGITPDELVACRCGQVDRVRRALESKHIYPFTDLRRRTSLSWF
jgi:hypothetical protein